MMDFKLSGVRGLLGAHLLSWLQNDGRLFAMSPLILALLIAPLPPSYLRCPIAFCLYRKKDRLPWPMLQAPWSFNFPGCAS